MSNLVVSANDIPIGQRVRERRRELNLTQGELARRVGMSVSYLSLIEHDKRSIGGRLLQQLAQALETGLDSLSDASDSRVAQELTGILSDSLFDPDDLGDRPAQRLVGTDPALGRAMLRLYRAYAEARSQVEALSHRLHQDPVLLELSHQILSRVTSVRSVSELLVEVDDIPPPRRKRFHDSLAQESRNLGEVIGALLDVLNSAARSSETGNPAEEVDDFIIDHNNYFPALEEAADDLNRLLPDGAATRDLIDLLADRHDVTIRTDTAHSADRGYRYDPASRRLTLFERLPEPTVRFQLARLLARLNCADALTVAVDDPRLSTSRARQRAQQALESYIAGAIIFPYDAFHTSARELRYDVDLLIQRFGGSFEQVCHRLVTLRRPGQEGVPLAFLRVDPAGNISKRFSLPNLRLPRYRESCAHWAVYQAFATPDRIIAQRAELPNGSEFLMIARSVTKQAVSFGAPRTRFGVMIACDFDYREDLVYGDGLQGEAASLKTPAGITCRLCPRIGCQQRAHAAILDSGVG